MKIRRSLTPIQFDFNNFMNEKRLQINLQTILLFLIWFDFFRVEIVENFSNVNSITYFYFLLFLVYKKLLLFKNFNINAIK